MGPTWIISLDPQIIAEEAKSNKSYKELLDSIREGKELKTLKIDHPEKEFNKGEFNKLLIITTKKGDLVYLDERLVPPVEARKKLLSKLQDSHSPEAEAWETAKSIWFWPGLQNKIQQSNKYFLKTCAPNGTM